jgi:hypothetical protein
VQTGTKGENLQADLQRFDVPEQRFDDLGAVLFELLGPGDLPTLNAAPTAYTTKQHVRTCPSRPFSSYRSTQTVSLSDSVVMSSITALLSASLPANPEPSFINIIIISKIILNLIITIIIIIIWCI